MNELKQRVYEQLALDYCCKADDIAYGTDNIFSVYTPLPGRRRWEEQEDMRLKILSVKGKLLVTGREDIVAELQERYRNEDAVWFMEAPKMHELNGILEKYGCSIKKIHPFFIAYEKTPVDTAGVEIRFFEKADIEQFRGDPRFKKAYGFEDKAPDELGVAAFERGKILGMAGASGDSADLWQIGIDVLPEARGKRIGIRLVTLLKNEILERGRIPYYGTAISHSISRNIAFQSGFHPAWAELTTEKI